VPLSEREQHALDLLERSLAEDDPELARRMGSRYSPAAATSPLFGLTMLCVLAAGFALVLLGSASQLFWLAALGAFIAGSTPFLAGFWITRRR